MNNEITELLNHPSLIPQLKRALGNNEMSLKEAIEESVKLAIQCRGLKVALHDLMQCTPGEPPSSAKRHLDEQELRYASIRMGAGK